MRSIRIYKFQFDGKKITFDPAVINPPQLLNHKSLPITSLALDVSGHCNMRCTYCAENLTLPSRKPISKKVIDNALDAIFKWSQGNSKVSIHLGSGEPLLMPNLVQYIGYKARKLSRIHGNSLKLYLTTNGTMLTKDICRWLIDDNWNVKISIDGNRRIHDQNRKDIHGNGTFNKIKGIVQFLARHIPSQFSTTSVLCRGTDPAEVFQEIAALGVNRIEIVPMSAPYALSLTLIEKDFVKYQQFILHYVKQIAKGVNLPLLIGFTKRLQRVLGYGNQSVACGAGRNFLAVGSDENLYPCFRFLGLKRYQLGRLNTGVDQQLVNKFQSYVGRPYTQRKKCKDCCVAPLCGGPCFACAELMFKKDSEPPPDYCAMVIAESQAAIWLAKVLRNKDPRKLLDLLDISLKDV